MREPEHENMHVSHELNHIAYLFVRDGDTIVELGLEHLLARRSGGKVLSKD